MPVVIMSGVIMSGVNLSGVNMSGNQYDMTVFPISNNF